MQVESSSLLFSVVKFIDEEMRAGMESQHKGSSRWDASQIPDMTGKTVVITGCSSGIGFEAAQSLARAGARLVMAVRNLDKGNTAASRIRNQASAATEVQLDVRPLDLADLDSVQHFADGLCNGEVADLDHIDVLINNAGVMAPPFQRTKQGFELQFGTNHLGHFALTGRLLPLLTKSPAGRVVTVSSMAHRGGRIDFDNLDGNKGYKRWREYSQSKLSNLIFAYELQRRLRATQSSVISIACHPGFAATNLVAAGLGSNWGGFGKVAAGVGNLWAQSAEMGSLPTVYAATHPSLGGGEYIGPLGRSGMRGYPGQVESTEISHDEQLAKKLWQVSQQLTGVSFLS